MGLFNPFLKKIKNTVNDITFHNVCVRATLINQAMNEYKPHMLDVQ